MEVLVGSIFGIDVSPTAVGYSSRRSTGDEEKTNMVPKPGLPVVSPPLPLSPSADESSETSSSIGAPGDSDEDEDDESEVSSKGDGKITRKFGSFGSLEDALPTKRGLSSHFTGKSKSFANLSEVVCTINNVKEVEKQENPFNKKRRILIQSRLARKSFYNCSFNPKSMPLLPVDENDYSDEEEQKQYDEEEEDCQSELSSSSSSEGKQRRQQPQPQLQQQHIMQQYRCGKFHERKLGSFKSHSCFALSDLQEEED